MTDFHTHTLLSDGALLPAELIARAAAIGCRVIAITDHVDDSNIEDVIGKTLRFVKSVGAISPLSVLCGVELTHIPPDKIKGLVKRARKLGA